MAGSPATNLVRDVSIPAQAVCRWRLPGAAVRHGGMPRFTCHNSRRDRLNRSDQCEQLRSPTNALGRRAHLRNGSMFAVASPRPSPASVPKCANISACINPPDAAALQSGMNFSGPALRIIWIKAIARSACSGACQAENPRERSSRALELVRHPVPLPLGPPVLQASVLRSRHKAATAVLPLAGARRARLPWGSANSGSNATARRKNPNPKSRSLLLSLDICQSPL